MSNEADVLRIAAEKMFLAITTKLLDGNSEQWMTKELREAYEELAGALETTS